MLYGYSRGLAIPRHSWPLWTNDGKNVESKGYQVRPTTSDIIGLLITSNPSDAVSSPGDRNAWHSLTLDERKTYWHEKRQEDFEEAIAKFNDKIPLSPTIPGKRARDSDGDIGSPAYKRALQRWNRYRKDYRPISSDQTASEMTTAFPFLRLLPEVRRMVYALIVNKTHPVLHLASDGSAMHPGGPIDLRIAFASKQLFAETMTSFLENNVIEVMISPDQSLGLPLLFYPAAVSATYWPLDRFRRVQVVIAFNQVEHCNFIRAELERFCNTIQHCQLSQLRIRPTCEGTWFREGMDEAFDEVLQCLERLRGIQELVFTTDMELYQEQYGERLVGTPEYRDHLRSVVTQPRDCASS